MWFWGHRTSTSVDNSQPQTFPNPYLGAFPSSTNSYLLCPVFCGSHLETPPHSDMGWKEGGWEGEELTPPQVTAGQKEFQGLQAAGLVTPQLTPKKGAMGSHHRAWAGSACPLSPAGWGGSWSPISGRYRAATGGRRQRSLTCSFTGYLLSTYYGPDPESTTEWGKATPSPQGAFGLGGEMGDPQTMVSR